MYCPNKNVWRTQKIQFTGRTAVWRKRQRENDASLWHKTLLEVICPPGYSATTVSFHTRPTIHPTSTGKRILSRRSRSSTSSNTKSRSTPAPPLHDRPPFGQFTNPARPSPPSSCPPARVSLIFRRADTSHAQPADSLVALTCLTRLDSEADREFSARHYKPLYKIHKRGRKRASCVSLPSNLYLTYLGGVVSFFSMVLYKTCTRKPFRVTLPVMQIYFQI
eukprot:g3422.t1